MDYFSRKPDFPTFEDIYIARAQGAIELERRGDEVACRFGPDGPAFMQDLQPTPEFRLRDIGC